MLPDAEEAHMIEHLNRLWVGIDAGKAHHWLAAVDDTGATVWSRKVPNDEASILTALGEILDLADGVHWAVDIAGTASALLLALLAAHGQQAVYVPGRTVNRMSGAYRGEAKTDARDAYVIADTARLRRDFSSIDVPAQLAANLALLTAHRSDLIADRVRMLTWFPWLRPARRHGPTRRTRSERTCGARAARQSVPSKHCRSPFGAARHRNELPPASALATGRYRAVSLTRRTSSYRPQVAVPLPCQKRRRVTVNQGEQERR